MNSPTTIRLIVADDHLPFRDGLALILNRQSDMEVVGQCGSGPEAVTLVTQLSPAVAILDVQIPGMTASQAVIAILDARPETRILLLTAFDSGEEIARAVKAGAAGCLLKESRRDEVLLAVRELVQGNRYLRV